MPKVRSEKNRATLERHNKAAKSHSSEILYACLDIFLFCKKSGKTHMSDKYKGSVSMYEPNLQMLIKKYLRYLFSCPKYNDLFEDKILHETWWGCMINWELVMLPIVCFICLWCR